MYNKEINILPGLKAGYQIFRDYNHPLAYDEGAVYLHRHVASIKIGRWLKSTEHVHHIDENKLNNTPDNLQILSGSEHSKVHNPTSEFDSQDRSIIAYTCNYCGNKFHPLRASKTKQFCTITCSSNNSIKNKHITKEVLDALIPTMSWVALGNMFGYTDNGIKKRAKALGCNITKAKYKHGQVA